jgi:type VII secretion-associated serine protease mycosin
MLAGVVTLVSPPAPAAADTVRQMQQWYLDAVKVLPAQNVTKGDGVVVAVIDSGVDAGHPDLAGAVLPGVSFGGSTSVGGRTDPEGHGTKMAGIIAARGGGEMHALGIAPRAKILPIAEPVELDSLAAPIRWAVDHGARVINLSIGRQGPSPADEQAAIAYALGKDVVVVASAGNAEQLGDDLASPASVSGVVAVSGVARSGEFWEGSARGRRVAIAAPADNIVNAGARNVHKTGYAGGGATSEAAAIVSGVAALIRSRYPKLNAANVVNRLLRTATDRGDPGRDELYGFGVVDAQRAVTASVPEVAANPLGAPRAGASAGAADPGGQARPSGSGDGQPLGSPWARLALVLGIGLLFVLVLVFVIVRVARRPARAKPAVVGPHPYPNGPPAYPSHPPSGHPPGYPPPPPGHRPPPGYPVAPGQPPSYPDYPPPQAGPGPAGYPPQAGPRPPGYPPPPPQGSPGEPPRP